MGDVSRCYSPVLLLTGFTFAAQLKAQKLKSQQLQSIGAQVSVSKLPSSKRDEGSSEQWPILGLGQEMCERVLEHSTVPKSQDVLKKTF